MVKNSAQKNNSQDIKRMNILRELISRYQQEYHELDSPSVPDEVYDSLVRELRGLEKKYPDIKEETSTLERVGGKPLESFRKVKHESRATSLNDVFSFEEVEDWQERINKLTNKTSDYFCELKLDGLTAILTYEKGIFVRGATRGDGLVGEDVTENLKMIEAIPLKLKGKYPDRVEVRGEVIMLKKTLEELNIEQTKLGKQPFANTRNAAAGSLRQLDPKLVKERKLSFYPWEIVNTDIDIRMQSEKQKYFKEWGFLTHKYIKKIKILDEGFDFINEIEKVRDGLPFGTDGIVISVEDLKTQETLGIVGKAPRFKIAYKYKAEQAATKLKSISVNVGRTGVLTPVAHFEPTLVAGSTVSKATLHNYDQIQRLGVKIGDTVIIEKAGDVIPAVVEVLKDIRTGDEENFEMPKVCPVCGANIEKKAGFRESSSSQGPRISSPFSPPRGGRLGQTVAQMTFSESSQATKKNQNYSVAYYCTNKNCPARNRRGLQHFVNVFEIYEIGPKILDRLKEEGLISDATDLFTLEKSDLAGLERFGDKSAENIINSIEEHKRVSLWRFIYALGIIHVGEQTAIDLAEYFHTLYNLINAKEEEISSIENIGPVVAKSIYEFFKDKNNLHFIERLKGNGVVIIKEEKKAGVFSGKTFVLTGTLPTLSREDAKKKIIENGGKVSGAVSPKTSFVLAGENPGSKWKEAEKLKIKIISEQEFLKMI
ncbi:MAG: NAD-dependent DNA ligase LigA [Candidatus Moranbacteria bacterium]|nr:NAD-dependent DNA ligase LigA [Candidatus Moranbacteria bacterium]